MKKVITYGTFDLLHSGHIRLLKRAKALGDYLIVALSTEEFNALKGKKTYYEYSIRKEMLEALRFVDLVIPDFSMFLQALSVGQNIKSETESTITLLISSGNG